MFFRIRKKIPVVYQFGVGDKAFVRHYFRGVPVSRERPVKMTLVQLHRAFGTGYQCAYDKDVKTELFTLEFPTIESLRVITQSFVKALEHAEKEQDAAAKAIAKSTEMRDRGFNEIEKALEAEIDQLLWEEEYDG